MSVKKSGKIVKGIGGFYYIYVEEEGLYECRARGIFRNKKMKPNVGDCVDLDVISETEKTGNIVKIHQRANQLIRPMVANVDQALVIFSIHEPEPNFNLLNRFLIMMNRQDIPVIICFNKADLTRSEERERIERDYSKCGCQLLFSSTKTGEGMEEMKNLIQGKTTVLAGPSGVGKSSSLNWISEGSIMETGEVSEKIKRGKHTTRHSELIHLQENTYLMDTPGFSSLYLEQMEKEELRYYFPEFDVYEGTCRFHGCSHIHEPDCKVKLALEQGEISLARYDDYCLLYKELSEQKKY